MRPPARRAHRLPAAVVAALALVGLGAGSAGARPAQAAVRHVHVTGTAYEFNRPSVVLAGARIHVAELPHLSATVRAGGGYDLLVPDGRRVTPFLVMPGYHTIHLQTFTTAGEDLRNVNFQTPTEGVAAALAAVIGVPLDADGDPGQCVIVSTFSTKDVRDQAFQGYVAYGAHGVAGASATAAPTLPAPTYFNEHVLPDPAQRLSSVDGGVIWPRVPAGSYRISATAPGRRFASFDATCRPGRVINANPPWGLHELAGDVPSAVTARWTATRRGGVRLRRLTASALPAGATVTVRCRGAKGCFAARRAQEDRAGSIDLLRLLGRAAGRLRAGRTLEVRIAAHAYNTKVVRWRIGARHAPRPMRLCIPLGNVKPVAHC